MDSQFNNNNTNNNKLYLQASFKTVQQQSIKQHWIKSPYNIKEM